MEFSPVDEPEIEAASQWPVIIWCFATTAPLTVPIAVKLMSDLGAFPSPSYSAYVACSFLCGVFGWIAAALIFMTGESSTGATIFGVVCSTFLIFVCAEVCISTIAIRRIVDEAPPKPQPPVAMPVDEHALQRRDMPDGIVKELQK